MKISHLAYYIIGIIACVHTLQAQTNSSTDSLALKATFSGQASAFLLFNPDNDLEIYGGARYIPQFNVEKGLGNKRLFDLEVSANISGNIGLHPFDSTSTTGDIRPYRAWVRYTRPQLEIRAGLQKINFGSASILRPLMWFDQIDPRDPLQLTDGVWGVLGRYYFLNNANIWLWSLYGNKNRRGFDLVPSDHKIPEFGGRFQFPTKAGEAGLTYHYRQSDVSSLGLLDNKSIPEHRIDIDGKWDVTVGLWVEATWIHKTENIGFFTNQNLFNIGIDYTFPVGSGINVIAEQLLIAYDEKAFNFNHTSTLTALSASYPLGLFDNLSAIIYYDWTNEKVYNTIQLQHQFAAWTLNVLAFWNPRDANLPQQGETQNLLGGKGIQLLAVYKY